MSHTAIIGTDQNKKAPIVIALNIRNFYGEFLRKIRNFLGLVAVALDRGHGTIGYNLLRRSATELKLKR